MQSQLLAAKERVGSGPGLKTTPAVVDLVGRAGEVNQGIFTLQDRRQGRTGIVLWDGMNRARLQPLEGLEHETRSALREQREKLLGSLIRGNGQRTLQEDIAGIESLVNAYGGGACDRLPIGHCPLDGSGAAVFGEKGGVQVEVAPSRQVQHPIRNDAAVGNHDDGIGLDRFQASAKAGIVLNLFRLLYRQTSFLCQQLNRCW